MFADLVQRGGDLAVVVRVFVRQHQIGGGFDAAGLVAVHPLNLGRPLPAFFGEVELERTDALGISAGEGVLDGRLPVEFGQLIGHECRLTRSPARDYSWYDFRLSDIRQVAWIGARR